MKDKELKFKEGSLKVGQTFKTGNEKGKILKLQWDPRFGYDVLYYSEKSNQNVWTQAESNFTLDSNDNLLSEKQLLELAKKHNWNEDKMLNDLRKQNLGISNSDLQAIVEGFLLLNAKDANEKFVIAIPQDKGDKNSYWVGNDGKLVTNIKNARIFTERIAAERVRNSRGDRGSIQTLVDAYEHIVETYHRNGSKYRIIKAPNGKFFNVYGDYKEATQAGPYDTLEEARKMMEKHRPKAIKDSNERLKSYNIKNYNTGITYKVKATSYRDAKDKYEKYIKDGNSFTYKGYVIIKSSYGWKVKIGNKIIEFATDKEAKEYIDLHKDTFSEDADFYGASQGSEKADDILFALQVMYGEPKYTYSDFQKMNLSQSKINEALVYVKKKGYNKFSYFDSFSEDATLAQLEIKNTFLEEDDDSNEVKYLGFNDDRKISFYEYGDKYFAFFDLENRVEIIEKDEVQRILKKNLIKETDQDKDELFREGDEGIATTVRSENEGGSK